MLPGPIGAQFGWLRGSPTDHMHSLLRGSLWARHEHGTQHGDHHAQSGLWTIPAEAIPNANASDYG